MKIKIFLIFPFIIFGCSSPTSNRIDLEPGQAFIKINKSKFDGRALMSHQLFDGSQSEKITLITNDSIQIEIIMKSFIEETVYWKKNQVKSKYIYFSLLYNYGGSIYFPIDGFFKIQRTDSLIFGEFDLILSDISLDSSNCRCETLKKVKGEFTVNIEQGT